MALKATYDKGELRDGSAAEFQVGRIVVFTAMDHLDYYPTEVQICDSHTPSLLFFHPLVLNVFAAVHEAEQWVQQRMKECAVR